MPAVLLTILLLGSGCALVAPFQPPQGAVFSNTKAPLDVNYDETALGTKNGESSAYNILGLFAFGDASTQTAAKNGDISIIDHADYAYLNFLYIFQKTTVTVYGK
ncbi:MAG TPA: hypothetical protein DCM68_02030 [Verrucomicrobia bacterium]|nr:hypothetical protein [Verrucomicrobiota bacterium]